jgi:hypothetical protein
LFKKVVCWQEGGWKEGGSAENEEGKEQTLFDSTEIEKDTKEVRLQASTWTGWRNKGIYPGKGLRIARLEVLFMRTCQKPKKSIGMSLAAIYDMI